MARGITENEVHQAADALVAGGDRPTVERIRAHLGTGSPNTVTRWLDTWWQGLGARLNAQQVRLAAPDAPDAVASLAGQWWALALEAATSSLQASIADERAVVASERATVQAAREALATEATALRAHTEAAVQAERIAVAQATELQRLVTRLEAQVEELTRQRDAAAMRETERETARQALEARLQALQAGTEAERDGFLQHIRAVEDRANTEIDRARQEAKEALAQLAAHARTQAAAEKAARQLLDQAGAQVTAAAHELGAQRARVEALEAQLGKLQDVGAAVEAAIRRAESPRKPGKRSGKSTSVTARKRAKIVDIG